MTYGSTILPVEPLTEVIDSISINPETLLKASMNVIAVEQRLRGQTR